MVGGGGRAWIIRSISLSNLPTKRSQCRMRCSALPLVGYAIWRQTRCTFLTIIRWKFFVVFCPLRNCSSFTCGEGTKLKLTWFAITPIFIPALTNMKCSSLLVWQLKLVIMRRRYFKQEQYTIVFDRQLISLTVSTLVHIVMLNLMNVKLRPKISEINYVWYQRLPRNNFNNWSRNLRKQCVLPKIKLHKSDSSEPTHHGCCFNTSWKIDFVLISV